MKSRANSFFEARQLIAEAERAGDPITLWELYPVQVAMLRTERDSHMHMTHHPADTLLGIPFVVVKKDAR